MRNFFGGMTETDRLARLAGILASVVGFGSGIPDLLGELGTAVWLTVMGTRSGRNAAPAAALAG